MMDFGASISSSRVPFAFLDTHSLLMKCCSEVVQCEETSAKLWHLGGSGCVVSAVALI